MSTSSALEAVLRRDRLFTSGGLVLIIALSWIYVLAGAGLGMSAFEMTGMPELAPPAMTPMPDMTMVMAPMPWTWGYALLMFFMWWVMMVAMMLPSAAPMILLYALVLRKERYKGTPFVPTGVFAWGYLIVWGIFSVLAATAQWGLERVGLLSSMMVSTSVVLGAILLIVSGLYQLSPLKHACLRHCRSPVMFMSQHWRPGILGALRMGIEHGAYCAGCCWVLMALLLYGGIMNLYWIIGIALFVLLEKNVPAGHWLGRFTGVLLVAWGGVLLTGSV